MSGTSLFKLSEQCKSILGKGSYQELIEAVKQAYSSVVKLQFYENKQDGIAEVDGQFIFTFGKETALTPVLDVLTDKYYITIPSSYLRLPHEMGINQVSFIQGKPFARIGTGSIGMWSNLKAFALGGLQVYAVEGFRMYFPKMTAENKGDILLKMVIALDTSDADAELNISPDMADQIVNMVAQKYSPKEKEISDKLI